MVSDLTILICDSCGIKELIYKSKSFKERIFMHKKTPIQSLDFLVKTYEKYFYDTQEIIKLYNNFLKILSSYHKVINSALKEYV